MSLTLKLARRELRGGIAGFRIFLLCLILGVTAIAAVGTLRGAILAGLHGQATELLGGDARMRFTYRAADAAELAFMDEVALARSEIVDFRSMAVVGEGEDTERGLTQIKAVDDMWPLVGQAVLEPAITLPQALERRAGDDLPGAVMAPVLAERLGLEVGDVFRLGLQDFHLGALLVQEPDNVTGGFGFGPRTLVQARDLADSGLIGSGTLYETEYRLLLHGDRDLEAVKQDALERFRDTGMRWRDSREPAPGIERFVDRMGAFLVLVGLAGLAVGGVGISAAVRAWVDGRRATIATLRTIGAGEGVIFRLHLAQVMILAALGVAIGIVLGVGIPLLAAPFIAPLLPIPVDFQPSLRPVLEAAFYGLLTALVFTIWPLARASRVRAAALYRVGGGAGGLPQARWLVVTGALAMLLVGGAVAFSGDARMAGGAAIGLIASLGLLIAMAAALRTLARWLSHRRVLRGRPALRLALSSVGGPGGETASVVLSLGLGLTVLAAIGQIEANMDRAIRTELPMRAPSWFFVDIQNDQITDFVARMDADTAVGEIETAPMMRGVLTRINGRPAAEVAGDHWVVRGDRGITYADAMPEGTRLVAGQWWPEGYTGATQVSFAAKEAAELGLALGDVLTVNILGRDIEATITSLREVDFRNGGIGFVMLFSPAALQGAPHTWIATVDAREDAEGRILRETGRAFPNVTAIPVREAVERATEALGMIATFSAVAAGTVLLTGFVVLIGAAAAGEKARVTESAILKTLGATRGRIMASFALRALMMGAAAGLVAVLAGALASWAVMVKVMALDWVFEPWSAAIVIIGGGLAVLLAGALFIWRPLNARPARVLRNE